LLNLQLEKYMPTFDANLSYQSLFVDVFLFLSGFVVLCVGLALGMNSWIFPDWPIFYISLVYSSPSSIPPGVYVVHGIYFMWVVLMCYSFLTVLVDIVIGFALPYILVLTEFICGREGGGRPLRFQMASSSFRALENLPMLYRHVQILNLMILDIISVAVIPFQALMSALAIYCNYSVIRHCGRIRTQRLESFWDLGLRCALLASFVF